MKFNYTKTEIKKFNTQISLTLSSTTLKGATETIEWTSAENDAVAAIISNSPEFAKLVETIVTKYINSQEK